VRWLTFLGVLLLLAVAAEAFFYGERQARAERITIAAIRELSVQPEFVHEAREFMQRKEYKSTIGAGLNQFPDLSRAVRAKVNSELESPRYRLGSVEIPFTLYNFILFVAPVVLLAIQVMTLVQIRAVHRLLASQAADGTTVQQILNSPFFERVTTHYGEHPWRHALGIGAANMPVVLAAFVYWPSSLQFVLDPDPQIAVQPDGVVEAPDRVLAAFGNLVSPS
jgi:hypothetical protein